MIVIGSHWIHVQLIDIKWVQLIIKQKLNCSKRPMLKKYFYLTLTLPINVPIIFFVKLVLSLCKCELCVRLCTIFTMYIFIWRNQLKEPSIVIIVKNVRRQFPGNVSKYFALSVQNPRGIQFNMIED